MRVHHPVQAGVVDTVQEFGSLAVDGPVVLQQQVPGRPDGVHLGTVDRIEGNRIKLIRADSGVGHQDEHHYIPRGLVAEVEGDKVRLTARGDVVADLFEQEQSGEPIGE